MAQLRHSQIKGGDLAIWGHDKTKTFMGVAIAIDPGGVGEVWLLWFWFWGLGAKGWFFFGEAPQKRTCVFGLGKQKTTVWTEYVYVVIVCICDWWYECFVMHTYIYIDIYIICVLMCPVYLYFTGILHLQGGVVIVTLSFHLSEIQFSLKKCSGYICAAVETPIWSLWDFVLGDRHQPYSRGLYTHYKDSLLKVGWPFPNLTYATLHDTALVNQFGRPI